MSKEEESEKLVEFSVKNLINVCQEVKKKLKEEFQGVKKGGFSYLYLISFIEEP